MAFEILRNSARFYSPREAFGEQPNKQTTWAVVLISTRTSIGTHPTNPLHFRLATICGKNRQPDNMFET